MLKYEKGFKDRNLIFCRVQWWNISVISINKLGKPHEKTSPRYDGGFLILFGPLQYASYSTPFFSLSFPPTQSRRLHGRLRYRRCNLRAMRPSSTELPLQSRWCYLWRTCTCGSKAENEGGIGRAWGEGGGGEKCRAAFTGKHWSIIRLHTAAWIWFWLRLGWTDLIWVDRRTCSAGFAVAPYEIRSLESSWKSSGCVGLKKCRPNRVRQHSYAPPVGLSTA